MMIVGDRTIPYFLEHHARTRPDVTALMTETEAGVRHTLTWSELDTLVNQTANWILGQGLKRGESLAFHLPNSLEFFILWLGAGKAGAVAVPVDPAFTAAELHYIVEHSDARLLFTQENSLAVARAAVEGCPLLRRTIAISLAMPLDSSAWGGELRAASPRSPEARVGPLDVMCMLYTSGTTGKPKGVLLTHANYVYGAEVFARSTRLGPDDRHLIALPLFHAAAECHAAAPSLVAGASMVIVERFSVRNFLHQAGHYGATRAALFGAPLRMLLSHYAESLPPKNPLRLVTFAQNLTPEQLREWETKFGIPLMQLWGMTETVGLPIMVPLNGERDNRCMGMPVVGYEVKTVDREGREAPAGVPGEIVVRAHPGWTVTPGYYKNPQATAELIRNGWLYSGDQALRDDKGQYHFLGRFKEVIKRGGENISPIEVEDVLKRHPAILDAAVTGIPDSIRDERVIAFVVFRSGSSADAAELKEWCRKSLSPAKIPEEFHACQEFPRTSVGKIQKHILQKEYQARN